jgi:hypothetical protein
MSITRSQELLGGQREKISGLKAFALGALAESLTGLPGFESWLYHLVAVES